MSVPTGRSITREAGRTGPSVRLEGVLLCVVSQWSTQSDASRPKGDANHTPAESSVYLLVGFSVLLHTKRSAAADAGAAGTATLTQEHGRLAHSVEGNTALLQEQQMHCATGGGDALQTSRKKHHRPNQGGGSRSMKHRRLLYTAVAMDYPSSSIDIRIRTVPSGGYQILVSVVLI